MTKKSGPTEPVSRNGQPDPTDAPPLEYASPITRFLQYDMVGPAMLLTAAFAALIIANTGLNERYHEFWETTVGFRAADRELLKPLHLWVNDGLMAVFFFLIGLEIKRELLIGELASLRRALLPAAAALGGMIVPAIVYMLFNHGGDGAHGWGIPMATDIAFAAGCLALLKKWVQPSLVVFLIALAIVDDLGAVIVIAVFYTEQIAIAPLSLGGSLIVISFILGRLGVRRTLPYAIIGIVVWINFLESGVHATIAGVLLAFSIPSDARYETARFKGRMNELLRRFRVAEEEWRDAGGADDDSDKSYQDLIVNHRQQSLIRAMNAECHHVEAPLQRLEYNIEPFAAFVIMPVFAFANAGLHLPLSEIAPIIVEPVTLGIFFGLLLGKPIGIFVACLIAVKTGLATLPRTVTWLQVLGVGFLAGVGFTMSLFINGLAFLGLDPVQAERYVNEGKLGIFLASIAAATAGLAILRFTGKK